MARRASLLFTYPIPIDNVAELPPDPDRFAAGQAEIDGIDRVAATSAGAMR